MNNARFSITIFRLPWIQALRRRRSSEEPLFLSLRTQERILFSERLSLYLRSGIPIVQGLSLIKNDATRKALVYSMTLIEHEVSSGKTLATSLRHFPKLFDVFYLHFVEIGERSGTLAGNLAHLATLLKRRQQLQRKIQSAVLYPCIVVVLTICVTGFLTIYAFPKIIPLFRGFHTQLPLPTRILIGFSDLITHHALLIIIVLIASLSALVLFARRAKVRRKIQYLSIRLPLVGTITKQYYIATVLRTLATLLESGIPLVPALALATEGITHATYFEACQKIQTGIQRGQRLSVEIKKYPHLFPSVVSELIGAGEVTGSLSESLRSLGDMFEKELEDITQTLTTLIEPALMIFMGLIVGFVALAIITPIYAITQNLHGTY